MQRLPPDAMNGSHVRDEDLMDYALKLITDKLQSLWAGAREFVKVIAAEVRGNRDYSLKQLLYEDLLGINPRKSDWRSWK